MYISTLSVYLLKKNPINELSFLSKFFFFLLGQTTLLGNVGVCTDYCDESD